MGPGEYDGVGPAGIGETPAQEPVDDGAGNFAPAAGDAGAGFLESFAGFAPAPAGGHLVD